MTVSYVSASLEGDQGDGLSALLVETDANFLEIGKVELREAGLRTVETATNLEEALSCVEQKRYDLLVLDTMDGSRRLVGPAVAKEVKSKGHASIIVGLSSKLNYDKYWKGLAHYFFLKDEFYSAGGGLTRVLQERFRIKPA